MVLKDARLDSFALVYVSCEEFKKMQEMSDNKCQFGKEDLSHRSESTRSTSNYTASRVTWSCQRVVALKAMKPTYWEGFRKRGRFRVGIPFCWLLQGVVLAS